MITKINDQEIYVNVSTNKIADYLYKASYRDLDYDFAYKYFDKNYSNNIGMCSAARKDNFYGRNYDWNYDDMAEFVVRIAPRNGLHGSIGISGMASVTESNMTFNAGKVIPSDYAEKFALLPFFAIDGINDAGVVCNINVVPTGDKGRTTGTNPANPIQDQPVNMLMLVRYILDHAYTAEHAVELVKRLKVYAPNTDRLSIECHFMVADINHTYILEFVENNLNILSDDPEDEYDNMPNNMPIMTNFYLTDWDGTLATKTYNSSQFNPSTTTLTSHASGVERYALLKSALESADLVSKADMYDIMLLAEYTKMYESDTNPFWYSEYFGEYNSFGDITINSTKEECSGIVAYLQDIYEHRQRDAQTWQTVHTSVYNMIDKTLLLSTQERAETFEFAL